MASENWIFIRGLTRGNIHWGDFPKLLAQSSQSPCAEFLEIPGNGLLHELKTPINPQKVIDHLREQSNFVKQKQTFHLCGISLGGMIALKWAELYPDEIKSVNVINSSLNQLSPMTERLNKKYYPAILRALFLNNPLKQESIILEITSNNLEKTKKHLPAFAEFSSKNRVSITNFVRQLLLAKFLKIKTQLKVPVLIITSEQDCLVHAACSDQLVTFLGAQQKKHPTAGHDLPLDDPEWLYQILFS